MTRRAVMISPSAADDGGYIAISDVTVAAERAAVKEYRLFGGIAVMLHVQRLHLDLPLRKTGDADYGVPPYVLRDGLLVTELENMGYHRVFSNTFERQIDEVRTASADLLVPAYTSKRRHSKRYGNVVTTEVPGLAFALGRPAVKLPVRFVLSDGADIETEVTLPDAASMLMLKAGARLVRDDAKDSTDLWRCLEVAAAEDVTVSNLPPNPIIGDLAEALHHELGRGGKSIPAITNGLVPETAGQLVTRVQALLLKVTGP